MDMIPLFGDVFDRRAAAAPDAVAVEYQGRQLTYGQLAARSARLAAGLVRRGVRRDSLVGVAVGPSLDLPAAILGVLRAGGAWLPLDPSYPADRLRYMIDDSAVRLVLATSGTADRVAVRGVEVIDLDGPADDGPEPPEADRPAAPRVHPASLAYVIYTSGSTGRPKGVALTQRGLANLALAQRLPFEAGPGDRVLQFAPTSFDASVFETVMALYAGATLVLAPRDEIAPGPPLADFLRDQRITHVTLPPSVLATLPPAELPELRVLVCAGEALPEHLAEQWLPGRRMFNAYGPTETTVWATLAELAPGAGKPSIGRAIHGVRVAVLDEHLRLVPAGTAGELAIGGSGLARGYLGQPGLTAERFVPDPAEPGARLYRTGDRVRASPDGSLEFLGRIDYQVKIRGFRIEPEEIARQLAEHAGVTDAVVTVQEMAAGPELVAYVTGTESDTARLHAHLAARLPGFMMPAAIVFLKRMPLTPSGKIDRAALPPAARQRSGAPAHPEPATPTGRKLAAILADLLSLDQVGADEDFFSLGGHSLLAGRLAARVRSELGRELPIRSVYETRTVTGMAAAIDAAGQQPVIPPVRASTDTAAPAPLSFPQERIWFLEQLAPGGLAYNAQATLELHGPLDPGALQATLTEIVRRHEVLRTAFRDVDGQPMQFPQPPPQVDLPLTDLSAVPEEAREQRTDEVIRTTLSRPFDLGAPPLARWALIRRAPLDHLLVHVEHHLVHDGWSFAVFLRELQAIYPALARGVPSPLPEPAVRYTDFARWQRSWMSGTVLADYLAYWTAELAGCPAALDLPTDRPRPESQSFAGATMRVDLPAPLCRRLRLYSRSRGITLYTTMLAGFAAVLSRYSGQPEVVVGSGVANRRLAEIEQMIGMVVNTVPLRIDLSATSGREPGLDELVRRVHATTGRAHQWQDVPLDKLIDALALPRDPSRNPLFQVMFSFHDSAAPEVDFAGIRGTVLERDSRSAKVDINVVVLPRAEQRSGHGAGEDTAAITLIWEYATDLFDARTMRALVSHYLTWLAGAMADPGTGIRQVPLLDADDQRQRADRSRGPATSYPAGRTIPDLFDEQAARHPGAVALASGGREHTYAAVRDQANRLAHLLQARGVGRDTPVGVLLERGDDMVIALLAVLKAGGGYVPLDPGYPPERVALMLADAAVPVVVTRSAHRDLIRGSDTTVLALDEAAGELAAAPAAAPPCPAHPRGLAYILFTSGSTGRPKGVMVEHRSVLRLVCGADYVAFGPDERFAQVADASFDAFTFELWGALLHGGTLSVIDTETLLSAGGLRRAIRDNQITTMFLTSALFTEVMADYPDTFAGMANLLVGGDVLNVSRIRRLLSLDAPFRPERLLNGYGPTETTTFAVCHLIRALPGDASSVPIGRPIANTSAYVVDEQLRLVPGGIPGELCIGGPGVARGYAGRPGPTAERFLPDPFTGGGSRMYRTGDIVRYRGDGILEFLGRADDQVKIRGFRVEPGEVEAAITAHPKVALAKVIVTGTASDSRLVAYLAPVPGGAGPAPAELREFLAERLPPYLLPAAYVELAVMPLTASGKVDRAALPPPEAARPAGSDFVAPRTETERELAGLMAELIGVSRVGSTDDFFALGGNSLMAMRLIARVNKRYAADVPLRRFLRSPTVARLAADVDAALGAGPAGQTAASAARPAVTGAATADESLLERIDELSDEEVDALLRDITEYEG